MIKNKSLVTEVTKNNVPLEKSGILWKFYGFIDFDDNRFLEKTEFINASKHQNKLLLKSLKRNDRHELTFSNKKW